jgi:outer membrane protein assembly factor BamB
MQYRLAIGRVRPTVWATVTLLVLVSQVAAENWPQWRGPRGNSTSGERDVPSFWNDQRGLVWTCELPPWGNSTPAVWQDSVFLTSHTDNGELLLLCVDARRGEVLWSDRVGTGTAPREVKRGTQRFHRSQNLASPSPVTDGKTVVAHFGNGDLAAYDYSGRQLWKRNLQKDYGKYTIWYGHANSPVIYDDMVISVCMQDSLADLQDETAESYLVAHDLLTGALRWKTERMTDADAEECDAYTTPVLLSVDSQPQLVVMGGNQLDAYDPRTGTQTWFLPGLVGGRTVTGPTVGKEMIFATRGMRGDLFAVRFGGEGELARRDIVWSDSSGTPDSCCPVQWATLLFTVTDDGIARCFEANTGELKWKQRLPGKYKASPVAADGRILFLNTEGVCTVVSASSRFDKVAENVLDDTTFASPAISQGRIYIRGHQALYCIGRK